MHHNAYVILNFGWIYPPLLHPRPLGSKFETVVRGKLTPTTKHIGKPRVEISQNKIVTGRANYFSALVFNFVKWEKYLFCALEAFR